MARNAGWVGGWISLADQVGEMQFGGGKGRVMGMSSVYRVRLVVWVGEMSSADWIGEMQFGGRMGGVMRSVVLDTSPR